MTANYKSLCSELTRIEDAMSTGKALVSNQGQALDGFSALAAFRDVATRARAALDESKLATLGVFNATNDKEKIFPFARDKPFAGTLALSEQANQVTKPLLEQIAICLAEPGHRTYDDMASDVVRVVAAWLKREGIEAWAADRLLEQINA